LKPGDEILILILADLGTDHRCFKIASCLERLGYAPTVLCDRPLTPLGPEWSRFRIHILTPESHYRGFLKALAAYLLQVTPILLSTRSPVWIVEDGTPLFWAALLGRLRGKKVIYDAREILLETPMIRDRPSRRFLWSLWLGAGMALIRQMTTVSPLFLKHYRARYPGKEILLLPNVPGAASREDSAEDQETGSRSGSGKPPLAPTVHLLYQGALRPGSGLRQVLTAIAAAPEYAVDIYGFGPEEKGLRELAKNLGLADRVVFHGAVPFASLRAPIARAHIGLHPLEPACLSFDLTLSNKIFDYIHGLTPVLLGPTAAHREFLAAEPVGVLAESLAPEAILAGLARLRAGYPGFVAGCRAARGCWVWEAFDNDFAGFLAGNAPGNGKVTQA